MSFDPNGVGVANGNLFGFPCTEAEADLIIIPIPWDATASYGKGTSNGPQAILEASTQLDFFHPRLEKDLRSLKKVSTFLIEPLRPETAHSWFHYMLKDKDSHYFQ